MGEHATAPAFEDFLRSQRKNLSYFARRFRLELAEVENTAYLAWCEGVRKFDPDHPSRASFETFVRSTLKHQLQAMAGGIVTVDVHGPDIDDTDEVNIEGIRFFERVCDDYARTTIPSAEEQLEELLTRSYADIAFEDVIRAHPVYAHPTYRHVIDGLLARNSIDAIAEHAQLTKRRVYQAVAEILRVIQRRDPVLDNRLIHLTGDETLTAEPVKYRQIDSLDLGAAPVKNRGQVLALAQSLMQDGQLQPVLIDQFSRVIKGVKRCVAARIIGLTCVKTILCPVAEGTESRSDEALARLRSVLGAQALRAPTLIPALANHVADGTLSALVAGRLAALPLGAQHVIVNKLPAYLVPMLSIADANALVLAHEGDGLLNALALRRKVIVAALQARLKLAP